MVALLDASGATYCTGRLITPTAVITAAHCLDGAPPVAVHFGATPEVGGETVGVAAVGLQPAYDPRSFASDLGVVRLAASPAVAPVPVYARRFDASFVGRSIRLVGFGRTSTLDGGAPLKRSGASRIDRFTDRAFTFSAAPSQTCFGGSGGPAFARIGGIDQLVGITSTGDLGCVDGVSDARVDQDTVEFVERFLAASEGGAIVIGGCTAAGDARADGALAIAVLAALWRVRLRRSPASPRLPLQ